MNRRQLLTLAAAPMLAAIPAEKKLYSNWNYDQLLGLAATHMVRVNAKPARSWSYVTSKSSNTEHDPKTRLPYFDIDEPIRVFGFDDIPNSFYLTVSPTLANRKLAELIIDGKIPAVYKA